VLSDKFFEFIPKCLFKVEGWGSSVGVANSSKLEIMSMGRWLERAQTWEGAPFTCGS